MELGSVQALKSRIEEGLLQGAERRKGTELQALIEQRPESRLAVGYSRKSANDYQLELRVQRPGGPAHKQAEELKETEAKGEANIEVITVVEIPAQSHVAKLEAAPLGESRRPLHIGLSVGHPDGGSGTLGAFVGNATADFILSNNHVFALMGKAKKLEPIFQPGGTDRWPLTDEDQIATLANFNIISRTKRNTIDSAIARMEPEMAHESNRIPKKLGFPLEGQLIEYGGKVTDLELKAGSELCKIGRTTGFTEGSLSAIALDMVTVKTPLGNVLFDDVIEVNWLAKDRPFTLPGDSGSLVFTKDGRKAIGLHFAGGTKLLADGREVGVSYACSLAAVLKALKVSLLS